MKTWARVRHLALALLFAACAGGCATTNPATPGDPLEGPNRAVFAFNEGLDKVLLKPVATGYKNVVPEPARRCVGNVFANVNDIFVSINSLLQGKVGDAVSDACRVLVNSTVGIAGCFDVASSWGLQKHNRDFGQTFGKWGVKPGPYLVLPVLGPSNFRDGIGTAIYGYLDPIWRISNVPTRNIVVGVRVVSVRADLLTAGDVLEEAALDKYSFVRDAYAQRRQGMIDEEDNSKHADADAAPAAAQGVLVPAELWFDQANQRETSRARDAKITGSAAGRGAKLTSSADGRGAQWAGGAPADPESAAGRAPVGASL
jgi:phospholipid-binding lipoprotein MlaA